MAPPERLPQQGQRPAVGPPVPGPQVRLESPAESLEASPVEAEGLGRGPLGRAGVLLDRTIARNEAARSRGETVEADMVASLRMTKQARDLIAAGEMERAADLLERAIAIDDSGGYGYLYLAYIHLAEGRHDQAEVFLARAEALLPKDPALRVELDQLRAFADSAAVPINNDQ